MSSDVSVLDIVSVAGGGAVSTTAWGCDAAPRNLVFTIPIARASRMTSTAQLAASGSVLTPGSSIRRASTIACALRPPLLYLGFVTRYGTDLIFWDDWTVVPMIDAAIHHHLAFAQLWSQHNENRPLFPNLLFVVFGLLDRFDTKTIMYFSAVLFSASYFTVLHLYRRYFGRPLGSLRTLLLGLVWFSPAGLENALWGFQLAWFMVVAELVGLLYIFSRPGVTSYKFAAAIVLSVVASYTAFQGLLLWPIGLLCLLVRMDRQRSPFPLVIVWCTTAAVAIVVYFRRFNFAAADGGSVGYAIHHPFLAVTFLLKLVGAAFPTLSGRSTAALGSVLLVCSVMLVFQFLRHWRTQGDLLLPVGLVSFGLLFDVGIASGRIKNGTQVAPGSRYTLPSMLILVGVVLWAFARSPRWRMANIDRPATELRPFVPLGCAIGALLFQVLLSTSLVHIAANNHAGRVRGARTLVNLTRIPPDRQQILAERYLYPSLEALRPLMLEAKADRLSVFEPGPENTLYRREGPPRIVLRKHSPS